MAERLLSLAMCDDEDDLLLSSSRQKKVYTREEFINIYEENEFRQRFRLSKAAALHVLTEIEEQLEFSSDRNNAVSPMCQLLLALRYYATGSYCLTLADYCGMSKATANRSDLEIREAVMRNYSIARFPKVIGLMDCTHIKIRSSGGNQAEQFRNRKGYFSLNVQVIGNENLEIIDLVVRWPGNAHDSTIFNSCFRKAMFEDGRYGDSILLADSGYPLSSYVLTPIANPTTNLYNESQIGTRNCVERLFGVWKRRFPVLALGFNIALDNIFPVVTATAVLHNILRQLNDPESLDDPSLPLPWDDLLDMGEMPPHHSMHNQLAGHRTRNKIIQDYFKRLI